jgi:two-component system, OmpR family, response regulator
VRVLLVEDDRELAGNVRKGLEEEGDVVQVSFDGSAGLRATAFDIIVLDVMFPFLDGLEVAKRLRFQNIRTPILLLTARDAPEDIVRGLDACADDYLTKPFSFDVLLARIRARTRSAGDRRAPVIGTRTCPWIPRNVRCGEATLS